MKTFKEIMHNKEVDRLNESTKKLKNSIEFDELTDKQKDALNNMWGFQKESCRDIQLFTNDEGEWIVSARGHNDTKFSAVGQYKEGWGKLTKSKLKKLIDDELHGANI